MTGAQVRLVERRRAIGLSHLRLITHAAELYATQYGKRPASLRDIEKSGLSPIFNSGHLATPSVRRSVFAVAGRHWSASARSSAPPTR